MSRSEITSENKDWPSVMLARRDWQSLVLPLVLMTVGAILVAGDGFGLLSFDRMQNLWPVAVILIGLAELMPGRANRQS
jgi:hypothetical protein